MCYADDTSHTDRRRRCFIVPPRGQASRRCQTQAPLGGKPPSCATADAHCSGRSRREFLVGTGLTLLSLRSWGRKRVPADAAACPPWRAVSMPAQTIQSSASSGGSPIFSARCVAARLARFLFGRLGFPSLVADLAHRRRQGISNPSSAARRDGLPVLATVFLVITSPLSPLMIAPFLIHEITNEPTSTAGLEFLPGKC
jgi:hypothetical protein